MRFVYNTSNRMSARGAATNTEQDKGDVVKLNREGGKGEYMSNAPRPQREQVSDPLHIQKYVSESITPNLSV